MAARRGCRRRQGQRDKQRTKESRGAGRSVGRGQQPGDEAADATGRAKAEGKRAEKKRSVCRGAGKYESGFAIRRPTDCLRRVSDWPNWTTTARRCPHWFAQGPLNVKITRSSSFTRHAQRPRRHRRPLTPIHASASRRTSSPRRRSSCHRIRLLFYFIFRVFFCLPTTATFVAPSPIGRLLSRRRPGTPSAGSAPR